MLNEFWKSSTVNVCTVWAGKRKRIQTKVTKMGPTITKQYIYATDGITEESIKAWEHFSQFVVRSADGWKPETIFCHPAYPIEFEGRASNEHVVMLSFRNEDQRIMFVTDGFLWGYAGTGPVGLVKVLAAVLFSYDLAAPGSTPERKLLKYLVHQPMDQAWSESLPYLAKLVAQE
jgi:hypothetical protein